MSKYHSKRTEVDGITFDSKKESARFAELRMLEKTGNITDLVLQPKFLLCDKVKWEGVTLRSRSYKADFQYFDPWLEATIVEDVKGYRTDLYKLKRSLFLNLYPQYIFRET